MAAAFNSLLSEPMKQPVTLITYWNRRRVAPDADNILASLKSAFDGFTDAGIWSDDRVTVHLPICRKADKLDPRVEVQLFDGLPPKIEDLISLVMKEDCKWQVTTE
jgi:Holliday junction resolvase RusA-like endonuclease